MIKLSFTGDISLDKPMLKASRNENGSYHFEKLFREVKHLFSDSDYLVGNLETVFGGADKGYNVKPFGYNSPDEFLLALKEFGFDLLSVANNHCLDEGIKGLKRTVSLCNKSGIATVGTVRRDHNYLVKDIKGVKVAFLSYTQFINQSRYSDHVRDLDRYVNMLYPYNAVKPAGLRSRVIHAFPVGLREDVKRKLGMPTVTKVTDSIRPGMMNDEYLDRLKNNILEAKSKSDLVVMLAHCGGQFNDEPGEYAETIFKKIREFGADIIIGNHPHVIHRIEAEKGHITAFSLGGMTLSPSAEYVHPDSMADYSLLVHIYIDEKTKAIEKGTYSILKGIEDESQYLLINAADKNKYKNDISYLQQRIGHHYGIDKDSVNEEVFYELS